MHTILVVDDCPDIAELEADLVESMGRRAIIASDGIAALACLHNMPVDLILLDLDLPTLSGQDVLDLLTADPTYDRIPVIVVSANLTGLRLTPQVVDVLSKPFDVDGLHATIERVVPIRPVTDKRAMGAYA